MTNKGKEKLLNAIIKRVKEKNIAQIDLANSLGVSKTDVNDVLSARKPISMERLIDYARAARVPNKAIIEAVVY